MSESIVSVANPQVLFTELDDGTGVLLNLDTKFYYSLNRTAVFVWKAIFSKTARTTPEIAKKLTESFRVEIADAERDVGAIVEEMLADGLLLAETT
jgi:hypothetical protein